MVEAIIEGEIQFTWRALQQLAFRFKRNSKPGTIDINFGKDSNEVWLDLENQFGKKLLDQLWEQRFKGIPIKIVIG